MTLVKREWKRSTFCDTNGCVEVSKVVQAGICTVAVRQSDAPKIMVVFTYSEWEAFIRGVRAGELD